MPFWVKLLICLIAIPALGALGGFVTVQNIPGWYAGLEKPPGTPPNWVFGPVWTTLYLMIGTSLALVWHKAPEGQAKTRALVIFAVQMVLNLVWTPVFFGGHLVLAGLLVIALLWITILMTILAFKPLHRAAAWLLVPYLLWVSYATYLNAGIWWLNRS